MGLLNKPKSVLDHGGDFKSGHEAHLNAMNEHHDNQHDTLYAGVGDTDPYTKHVHATLSRTPGAPPSEEYAEYPRHLYSKDHEGYLEVTGEEQHSAALASGVWFDHEQLHPVEGE